MKLDFNGAVRNALKEQEVIRELLEKIEAGRNEQQRDDSFNNGNYSYFFCSDGLSHVLRQDKRVGDEN